MSIKITAESTCDLSRELLDRYNITTIPLYITDGENTYRDGVDITRDDLFRMAEKEGKKLTTAAINMENFMEVFSSVQGEGDQIIHFSLGSDLSCCYQNARLAAAEMKDVYVVDSRNLSSGIALLILDAAEMAAQGVPADEIVRTLEEKKAKLDSSFVLETLEYLARGGRCSALTAFGANLMQIKPCIEVKDGKMGVGKKYRGQLTKAFIKYIKERLADVNTLDLKRIFITDSGLDQETRQLLKDTVLECAPFEEVLFGDAGCSISNHCGPHTMGILFFRK